MYVQCLLVPNQLQDVGFFFSHIKRHLVLFWIIETLLILCKTLSQRNVADFSETIRIL